MVDRLAVLDTTSRKILKALDAQPRATVAWLTTHLGMARGTVQIRLNQLSEAGVLRAHSVRLRPETLGFTTRALVTAEVEQDQFENAMVALHRIPEILECVATTGLTDLFCQVVARDSDDLYRVGQQILQSPGIRRTATSIILKDLIEYRSAQLL